MSKSSYIFPVILSGGAGTRLWPLSRKMYPKQFVHSLNGRDTTLLAGTLQRIAQCSDFEPPIVVCNSDHRFLVREEVARAKGPPPQAIILEPVGRNTAPAVAVAALAAMEQNKDAVIVIVPSDHLVKDEAGFVDGILRAAEVASTGRLVMFGIKPDQPQTGYGYIRRGAPLPGGSDGFAVDAFFEKPNLETAREFLEDGNYFWNSGIFVLHAHTILEELDRLAPAIVMTAREALTNATPDLEFLRLDIAAFAKAPNISLDYAVMERTKVAAMLPLDVGWSDAGSWTSLWEVAPRDANGNVIRGDVVPIETQDCYVHSDRSLIATIGVKDLIIVDTADALLVTDKSRAQDVSGLVSLLKNSNRKEAEQHVRNYRPWGFFESLSFGDRFQVKLLHVTPGSKLSLQMHHHRSEHWVVVRGTAKVTIDGEERIVRENESVYITATSWHRLENPGKVALEMIEVQIGTYLGEDDIIRAADDYRRRADETK